MYKTYYGHCKFIVLPFGFTNTPATFMCLMNGIFSKCLDKFVLFVIDEILIYSNFVEERKQHLEIVLITLRENPLYIKFTKCEFYQKKIQ